MSMQALGMVCQSASQKGLHGIFHIGDICEEGADAAQVKPVKSAHAHAACQQNLTIRDRFDHGVMTLFRSRICSVLVVMLMMSLPGKIAVAGFGTRFPVHDLSICDGENFVIFGSSKVCRNGS